MRRRFGFAWGILGATVLCGLLVLAGIQLASDSLFAAVAQRTSLPTRVPSAFGVAVYRALDRVAPAPYVESTLAMHALANNDPTGAQYYALRMPASPARDELLATVADARGETQLAYEYYFTADDVDALQQRILQLAVHDPTDAYGDERRLKDRLVALLAHPDAVADAYWTMGKIATYECVGSAGCDANAELRRGLSDYRRARALAPLSVKYILSIANQQVVLGDLQGAKSAFETGLNLDPESGDMLAGLGIVALRQQHRATAQAFAARARTLSPRAAELLWLERLLK